jgi:hypothetical protein
MEGSIKTIDALFDSLVAKDGIAEMLIVENNEIPLIIKDKTSCDGLVLTEVARRFLRTCAYCGGCAMQSFYEDSNYIIYAINCDKEKELSVLLHNQSHNVVRIGSRIKLVGSNSNIDELSNREVCV